MNNLEVEFELTARGSLEFYCHMLNARIRKAGRPRVARGSHNTVPI